MRMVLNLYLFGALVLHARGSLRDLRAARDARLRGLPLRNLAVRWTFTKERPTR